MAYTFFSSNSGFNVEPNHTSSLGHFHGSDRTHTRTGHTSSSMRNYSPWFRALGLADDHVGPVQISFSNKSIGVIVGNASRSKRGNRPTAIDGVNNMSNNVIFDGVGDGQIHSLQYKKNGPYTCPRCNQLFSSSQRFSAHARSHYKYESKAQRKNRLKSKIQKKDLCFQMVNGQLTLVPISSEQAEVANTRFARSGGYESIINVKVEVDEVAAPLLLE